MFHPDVLKSLVGLLFIRDMGRHCLFKFIAKAMLSLVRSCTPAGFRQATVHVWMRYFAVSFSHILVKWNRSTLKYLLQQHDRIKLDPHCTLRCTWRNRISELLQNGGLWEFCFRGTPHAAFRCTTGHSTTQKAKEPGRCRDPAFGPTAARCRDALVRSCLLNIVFLDESGRRQIIPKTIMGNMGHVKLSSQN